MRGDLAPSSNSFPNFLSSSFAEFLHLYNAWLASSLVEITGFRVLSILCRAGRVAAAVVQVVSQQVFLCVSLCFDSRRGRSWWKPLRSPTGSYFLVSLPCASGCSGV